MLRYMWRVICHVIALDAEIHVEGYMTHIHGLGGQTSYPFGGIFMTVADSERAREPVPLRLTFFREYNILVKLNSDDLPII